MGGDVGLKAVGLDVLHQGERPVDLAQPGSAVSDCSSCGAPCVCAVRASRVVCVWVCVCASLVPYESVDGRVELAEGKLLAQEGALGA